MKKTLAITLALAFGAMPTAIAQENSTDGAVPYAITFDGTYYPAALDRIEYPYTAARLGLNGTCSLYVHVDEAGHIAGMSVADCSSPWFSDAAQNFVEAQTFTGSSANKLETHEMSISWTLDPDDAPI
ncbi:MAG: energy transducer TonB, partial [Pseudomonadota bacterium]